MLTITRIITYTKVAKPERSEFKAQEAQRLRDRRAQARAEGKCGSCCARRPSPGFKTCDYCRTSQSEAEKRKTKE